MLFVRTSRTREYSMLDQRHQESEATTAAAPQSILRCDRAIRGIVITLTANANGSATAVLSAAVVVRSSRNELRTPIVRDH